MSKITEAAASDWMKEIDQDARAMQELVKRINSLHIRMAKAIRDNDKRGSLIILADCMEGMKLFCDLAGVKG